MTLNYVEVIPGSRIDGVIRPPGSKSLTNRALLCAAFAAGRSRLTGALCSEDTEVMIAALRKIGVVIGNSDGGRTLDVDPAPRRSPDLEAEPIDLFIANSGTTVRFLTAALSAAGGHFRLHGVARMHQRPIGDLVGAIGPVIDGTILTESPGGCPPVHIASRGWRGTELAVAGSVSSQFLSGLMMAAPLSRATSAAGPVRISVRGDLVSRPYVDMTTSVMQSFGATVTSATVTPTAVTPTAVQSPVEWKAMDRPGSDSSDSDQPDSGQPDSDPPAGVQPAAGLPSSPQAIRFDVSSGGYRGTEYAIEPDASAASYFWAAAAISGGSISVTGLSPAAIQGDVGFCQVLESMGCEVNSGPDSITVSGRPLRGVDVNMNAISDTVQTLAVVALFAAGPTRVRGVAHNRFKETDRIGDLASELRKLGAGVQEHDDGLTIQPPASGLHGATLETYHDHRMAMSLSLAGLRIPGVRILNPACTSKTYPEFFADLEKLIGRAHHWA